MTVAQGAWSGRLAFGPWWLLYSGAIGPTEPHAHHAFQIIVHGGTAVVHGPDGDPRPGPVVVVEPDVAHRVSDQRHHAHVVFIDPETDAGHRLRSHRASCSMAASVNGVASIVSAMHPQSWHDAERIVARVLAAVLPTTSPGRPTRHRAVNETLRVLPDLIVDGVTVRSMAERTGLSTSRLTHLFSREVGLPLRSYTKWLRLVSAAEHLASGASITEAAHRAGFADSAHFTRTFHSMFGLAPSDAIGLGTWLAP